MQEAERRSKKIKDTQRLAKIDSELKMLELKKTEMQEELRHAEQVLPQFNTELSRVKSEAEQKKREADRKFGHSGSTFHPQRPVIEGDDEYNPQPVARSHEPDSFQMRDEKMKIDREYTQKQRDIERQMTEAREKINDIKRKQYHVDRQLTEINLSRQQIQRELDEIKQGEDLEKRATFNAKLKNTQKSQQSAPFDEKIAPED